MAEVDSIGSRHLGSDELDQATIKLAFSRRRR
jgi:hypothetical protein